MGGALRSLRGPERQVVLSGIFRTAHLDSSAQSTGASGTLGGLPPSSCSLNTEVPGYPSGHQLEGPRWTWRWSRVTRARLQEGSS